MAAKKAQNLVFSHIRERDIDLLLVEELSCSTRFREWLLRRAAASLGFSSVDDVQSFSVQHSLARGTKAEGRAGETDIHVEFTLGDRKIVLLIENKIAADFTHRQPERYREQAERLVRDGSCDHALTVLLRPSSYPDKHSDTDLFDVQIDQEDLSRFFQDLSKLTDGEISERYRFRGEIIDHALGGTRRGYVPQADDAVTEFWSAYYAAVQSNAPSLRMPPPQRKASGSQFIKFECMEQSATDGYPAVTMRHKLRPAHSRVDIEFQHWGAYVDRLRPELERLLESPMKIRVGKSRKNSRPPLMISADVPELDIHGDVEPQRDAMRECLELAERMRDWYGRHFDDLKAIARSTTLADPESKS